MTLIVAENTNRDPRTVTVTVNGATASVVQNPPGCSYTLSPTTLDVNASSESASVGLTATAGCPWTATSSESWITPRTASGTGSATVVFDIMPNPGLDPRRAFLTIANQRVTVTQQGR